MPTLTMPTEPKLQMTWLCEPGRAENHCAENCEHYLTIARRLVWQRFGRDEPETANDVAADAMAVLIRRARARTLERFKTGVDAFMVGVMQTLIKAAIRAYSTERSRLLVEIDPDQIEVDQVPEPFDELRLKVQQHTQDCLKTLSDQQRQAIIMQVTQGPADATPKQIAAVLDTSPGAISVALHRARLRLQECLRKKGMKV